MNEHLGRVRGGWSEEMRARVIAGVAMAFAWLLAWLLAGAAATMTPPGTDPLWYAPQGISASTAATDWLADLDRRIAATRARCPDAAPPDLAPRVPVAAFQVAVSPQHPVVFTKDAVVQRMLVLGRDARGCPWLAEAGRFQPFHDRWLWSPLASVRLPVDAPAQTATVLIADAKTLRPWLRVDTVAGFERRSSALWVLLGGCAAVLTVLLIIGLGLRRYYPSPVADAYCIYIATQMFYQTQALGLGPAWVPGWPQADLFPAIQGVATAGVVAGLGMAMVAFLRPTGVLRAIIRGGVTLAAINFLLSIWYPPAYRVGSVTMLLLAPAVLFMLVRGLRGNEPWVRWFAVGLCATIIGGGAQTATAVFNGAGLGALGNFAFPLGNLIESACWLVSLLVRLRAERIQAERRLLHEATRDPLTGLPNRLCLTADRQSGLSAAREPARTTTPCTGLVLLDLDRFKAINASLGYAAGDEVLVATARRVRAAAPPGSMVAHLGADTFAVLLYDQPPAEGAREVARRIGEHFREPLTHHGGTVHVRASMGVVEVPAPDAAVSEVLRDADSALNLAKVGGGNRIVDFMPVMRAPALKRFRLEQDLVDALRAGALLVYFQPIVALSDRRATGFEALTRWHHPVQGWVSPADFIPVAEETGLIVPLGQWVMEQASGQIRRWKLDGCWQRGCYVSVNLSGTQLFDDALLEHIDGLRVRDGLRPGELRLELTETAVITNIDAASAVLPALRERLIPLYMDDFGTGYSSLSHLQELRFDVLKIDRSFITGIETGQESQILVRTVLALAGAMGLEVVAEGVETEAQADLLECMGCTYAQGFLFSPALPAAGARAWLG